MLDEIATYLDTQLASLTAGTNLFVGRIPESPSNAVALYEPASAPPVYSFGGDGTAGLERPRVQIHVRNESYATGRSLAFDVWQEMHKVVSQSLSGTFYQRIEAIDSPHFLMRDDNDRAIFNMNFQVMKEPAA